MYMRIYEQNLVTYIYLQIDLTLILIIVEGSGYINKSKKGFKELSTSKQRKDECAVNIVRTSRTDNDKRNSHQSRNSISEVIK